MDANERGMVVMMPEMELLRDQSGKPPGAAGGKPMSAPESDATTEEDPAIRCRRCKTEVTRDSERMSVNGAHRHTFANPHGLVFEIGCFRSVVGCGTIGASSAEFTWFAGFTWRVLICGRCMSHLGWRFDSGAGRRFHGLILNRIEES